jgi:hypothetical protein
MEYWITEEDDGWAARRAGTERAAKIFPTQKEAEDYARDILKNSEGGELITKGRDGKIRSKDTINAPDPFPPRDTEH